MPPALSQSSFKQLSAFAQNERNIECGKSSTTPALFAVISAVSSILQVEREKSSTTSALLMYSALFHVTMLSSVGDSTASIDEKSDSHRTDCKCNG